MLAFIEKTIANSEDNNSLFALVDFFHDRSTRATTSELAESLKVVLGCKSMAAARMAANGAISRGVDVVDSLSSFLEVLEARPVTGPKY